MGSHAVMNDALLVLLFPSSFQVTDDPSILPTPHFQPDGQRG